MKIYGSCSEFTRNVLWESIADAVCNIAGTQCCWWPSVHIQYGFEVTSFGILDLGQHYFRKVFFAWWHQIIINWNFGTLSSLRSYGFNQRQFHRKCSRYQLDELTARRHMKSPWWLSVRSSHPTFQGHGHIWGLQFNRYVCFSFLGNQTILAEI